MLVDQAGVRAARIGGQTQRGVDLGQVPAIAQRRGQLQGLGSGYFDRSRAQSSANEGANLLVGDNLVELGGGTGLEQHGWADAQGAEALLPGAQALVDGLGQRRASQP